MRRGAGHFWPYSAWEGCVNGALASKLNVHINIVFIIVTIIFLEFTGTGKGQWPGEWGGPVSGELLYYVVYLKLSRTGSKINEQAYRDLMYPNASDRVGHAYPEDDLLQIFAAMPESEICQPTQCT